MTTKPRHTLQVGRPTFFFKATSLVAVPVAAAAILRRDRSGAGYGESGDIADCGLTRVGEADRRGQLHLGLGVYTVVPARLSFRDKNAIWSFDSLKHAKSTVVIFACHRRNSCSKCFVPNPRRARCRCWLLPVSATDPKSAACRLLDRGPHRMGNGSKIKLLK